jgi:intein/homing endonuclease
VNGDMMKVITRSGRIVETTTSHSHLIRSEETQRVEPIVGANMTVGMRIPVAKYVENLFDNF